MPEYRYGTSVDDHSDVSGDFKTLEEAIKEGQDLYDKASFYVGKYEVHSPIIDGDDIIEMLESQVEVESGDSWLQWLPPNATEELGELVQMVVMHWLKKHDRLPHFGVVVAWEYIEGNDK